MRMKCIIADAGPIIALCKIGKLKLLNKLFDQCIVSDTVFNEVVKGTDSSANCLKKAIEVNQFTVKQARAITATALYVLDEGEASSISLAIEIGDCGLLIDEFKGREVAKRLGVPVIGTAGLLLLAKKKGIIPSVIPLLLEIRANGYWFSDKFLLEISVIADEKIK